MQVAYILNQLLNVSVGVNGEIYVPYNQIRQHLRDFEKTCISWDVEDFKKAAFWKEGIDWNKIYDESWFEHALHCMIEDHDAELGVNWATVGNYLDKYCKHNTKDNLVEFEENFNRKEQ